MTPVRVAKTTDGAAIAAIYAPIVRDTAISFELEPPSADEMGRRVAATLLKLPWLVATHDDVVVGYAYASAHKERPAYRWSVDVTVYVAENARGRGIGSRLYGVLVPTLRLQGFRAAFAGIALPNSGSVALHEAIGFEPIGLYEDVGFKLGQWRSVRWWRLGLSDDAGAPTEPTPFQDLRHGPAFSAICASP